MRIILKQKSLIYYQMPINYESRKRLIWKLDEDTMQILKRSQNGGRITSSVYDSIWALDICPHGDFEPNNKGKCVIGLTLCGIPSNTSKLRVQSQLCVNQLNFKTIHTDIYSLTGDRLSAIVGNI